MVAVQRVLVVAARRRAARDNSVARAALGTALDGAAVPVRVAIAVAAGGAAVTELVNLGAVHERMRGGAHGRFRRVGRHGGRRGGGRGGGRGRQHISTRHPHALATRVLV